MAIEQLKPKREKQTLSTKQDENEPYGEISSAEPSNKSRIRQAFEDFADASFLRAEASDRHGAGARVLEAEAEQMENSAERMLTLAEPPVPVAGKELLVQNDDDRLTAMSHAMELRKKPMVAARASHERLGLVEKAGALILAADAVEDPASIEKMLAHQIAVAHKWVMDLFADADRVKRKLNNQADLYHLELLLGNAQKLMRTCQNGLQALTKAKKGGKQEVVVQHIHVEKDAQAVVTGKMNYPDQTGGHANGRRGQNEE